MYKGLETDIAPDFSLTDTQGKKIRLSDYKGKKHIVLVFNRGLGWPHCRHHMAQLRQDYQKFVKRNTEVIAVAPDDAQALRDFWHKEQIPFVGLPDQGHKVADLYNQEVNALKFGRMPALFVIDKQGIIHFKHYSSSMSDIVPDEQLLSLLNTINKEKK